MARAKMYLVGLLRYVGVIYPGSRFEVECLLQALVTIKEYGEGWCSRANVIPVINSEDTPCAARNKELSVFENPFRYYRQCCTVRSGARKTPSGRWVGWVDGWSRPKGNRRLLPEENALNTLLWCRQRDDKPSTGSGINKATTLEY